jgi:hypothetical protein
LGIEGTATLGWRISSNCMFGASPALIPLYSGDGIWYSAGWSCWSPQRAKIPFSHHGNHTTPLRSSQPIAMVKVSPAIGGADLSHIARRTLPVYTHC